jgi:hypothetical protein
MGAASSMETHLATHSSPQASISLCGTSFVGSITLLARWSMEFSHIYAPLLWSLELAEYIMEFILTIKYCPVTHGVYWPMECCVIYTMSKSVTWCIPRSGQLTGNGLSGTQSPSCLLGHTSSLLWLISITKECTQFQRLGQSRYNKIAPQMSLLCTI